MKKSFDRVAWIYDFLAGMVFGRAIRRSQTVHLSDLPKGGKVLIVGGGTGWILIEILKHLHPDQVIYIDSSPEMIYKTRKKLARKRPQDQGKVHLVVGPLREYLPAEPMDLVITNFFLDVLPPDQIWVRMSELKERLVEGGYWHFADFNYPKKGAGRQLARILIPFMYFFFRKVAGISARQLPNFGDLFDQLGMTELQEERFYGKLIRSVVYRKQN